MTRPADSMEGLTGPADPTHPQADEAWVRALPKAELHLHLAGSVRPATAVRLARERGRFAELSDEQLAARMVAPPRCRDQAELLEAFAVPVAVLQDAEALQVAAVELVEELVTDGVRYAEIRFAPSSHIQGGLDLAGVIAAVAAGVTDGVRAAVAPIDVRLIVIAMRTDPRLQTFDVARAATDAFEQGLGVVGFDLAGLEATAPDVWTHFGAFNRAHAWALGVSVHAGEWGGAAQVRDAVRVRPQRIAHGGPAIDDPELIAELIHRGITLDLCPTSNLQAGLVERIEDHPLPSLLRAGVFVTVSTDDRTVSSTTLSRELLIALGPLGLTRAEVVGLQRHALRVAFLHHERSLRSRLAGELERWLMTHKETLDR